MSRISVRPSTCAGARLDDGLGLALAIDSGTRRLLVTNRLRPEGRSRAMDFFLPTFMRLRKLGLLPNLINAV